MTREEYMALTNIKSVEEAQGYLNGLRRNQLILLLPVLIIVLEIWYPAYLGVLLIPSYAFIVLWLIYSQVYFYKVLKALDYKRPRSVMFAYNITSFGGTVMLVAMNSLRIIIGTKQPPEAIESDMSSIINQSPKEMFINKPFLKNFLWAVLAVIGLFILVAVALNYGLL